METRIALIGIVLDCTDSVEELNHLLSEYGQYIVGRLSVLPWTRRMTLSVLFPGSWVCCPVSARKRFMPRRSRELAAPSVRVCVTGCPLGIPYSAALQQTRPSGHVLRDALWV